jgi:ligand-binding sensor domain-containing protein
MNKQLFQLVISLLIAISSFAQLLPLNTKGTSAEMGNYFSSYYDRSILKATLGNTDLFQDDDGVIYVANLGDGILQYDGQRVTRAIDEKGNKLNLRIWSILQDSKKLMYVSAQFSFGYLEKNKFGDLVYTSLSIALSKKNQLNSNVRSAVLHNDTAFFSSFHSVYLYKNKQLLKVVTFKNLVGRLRENTDGVYLEVENEGLFKFQDNAFKQIAGSEKNFKTNMLDAMYQLDNGDHLLVGDKVGAYLYHTNGKFEKVKKYSASCCLVASLRSTCASSRTEAETARRISYCLFKGVWSMCP